MTLVPWSPLTGVVGAVALGAVVFLTGCGSSSSPSIPVVTGSSSSGPSPSATATADGNLSASSLPTGGSGTPAGYVDEPDLGLPARSLPLPNFGG